MSIARHNREASDALRLLERAAEVAPEGTYEDAKALVEFFADLHSFMRKQLAPLGIKPDNTDRYRNVEAAVYAMLKEANPDATMFVVAEGFGEHVDGPAGERVMAGAIRDRDFLRGVGLIPPQGGYSLEDLFG